MEKNLQIQNQDNTDLWLKILLVIIFWWVLLPLFLATILSRVYFKWFYKTQEEWKKYLYWTIALLILLLSTNGAIAGFILIDYSFSNIVKSLLSIIYITLCLVGLIFTLSYLFLVSFSIYLWNKRNIKIKKLMDLKKLQLKESKLDSTYFKEEKKWIVKMLSYDILDLLKEIDEVTTINKDYVYLDDDKKCFIDDRSLGTHSLIVGGTGTGKTNTLLHFVKNSFERNNKVIFVDGKADQGLVDGITKLCKKMNKKLRILSTDDKNFNHKVVYNPFDKKTKDEIITLLLELDGYSDSITKGSDSSFYKNELYGFLQFIIPIIIKSEDRIDFNLLYQYSDAKHVRKLLSDEEWVKKTFNITHPEILIDKKKDLFEQYNSLGGDLWYRIKPKTFLWKNAFSSFINSRSNILITLNSFMNVKNKNDCFLILVNTAANESLMINFVKMFIIDLKQNMAYNKQQVKANVEPYKVDIFFDEAGSYATNAMCELLTKGRSFGYRNYISVQGVSQLKVKGDLIFNDVLNNTNTRVIMRHNDQNIEEISHLFGTETMLEVTSRVDGDKSLELAGSGSAKAVERFVIHPNTLKYMKDFHAIVSTKVNGQIKVYKEPIKISKVDLNVDESNDIEEYIKPIEVRQDININQKEVIKEEPITNNEIDFEKEIDRYQKLIDELENYYQIEVNNKKEVVEQTKQEILLLEYKPNNSDMNQKEASDLEDKKRKKFLK